MKRKWIAAALLLTAVLLSGCSEQTPAVPPQLREPAGVQADTVQAYRGEIYQLDIFEGSVRVVSEELFLEEGGTVARVYAYPGAQVQAGDVLLELEVGALTEQARKLEEELTYLRQEHAYADALVELDIELLEIELRQLQAQRADEMQLSLKKNEIAQKKAQLRHNRMLREPEMERRQKKLDEIRAQSEACILRAPFDGRIVFSQEMAGGSQVSAYQTLMCISDESRFFIETANVSEGMLQAADFLYVQAGGEYAPVTVQPIDREEYIAAALSGNTPGTRFEWADAAQSISFGEGDYAALYVVRDYHADALLLPVGVLAGEGAQQYVYVDEGGKQVRRTVEVGMMTDSLVQITQGLQEGEVVYVRN